MIGEPRIVKRTEQPYLGIRLQAPYRGMFTEVNKQFPALDKWLRRHGVAPAGPRFLRYHVIDMANEMDVEVCVPVATPLPGDGHAKLGLLPAVRYAILIYIGLGLAANKALQEWIRANNLQLDKWTDHKGDAFGCRYEAYLTDPKVEPRKKQWEIELAMKLADKQT